MSPLAPNAVLVPLVAASGVACIAADYAKRPSLVYVFKPLTMVFVVLIAALGLDNLYAALVVAALLFSLAGDVFLMLPSDRFVQGLASFLVAHVLYVAAFALHGGAAGPVLAMLPFALVGGLVYAWLHPGLGRMAVPVFVYVTVIALMGGFATSAWLFVRGSGAFLAWAGAMLFMLSDTALAANRFRTPFAAAQAVVLSTYFSGQCLIALSAGGGPLTLALQ